ncbi:MAG TPA: DUF58 domain-containing protein, partial [Pseudomonadota bacterium]|nr:DUF58 domain-containing protein [Pseudomonadota bacterium]
MRPAPALIAGVLLLAAIGLAVAFGLWSRSALMLASLLLLALAIGDVLALRHLRTPLATRELAHILPLGM